MTKIFKKTNGNSFKLLTENINIQPKTTEVQMLNAGLKKLFLEGTPELSYMKLQNMGFGFIKDIHSAKETALEESRLLAEEFGYKDDFNNKKFIKEENNIRPASMGGLSGLPSDETDMSNPTEKREVQIGKEMLQIIDSAGMDRAMETPKSQLRTLAQELIQMHGQ